MSKSKSSVSGAKSYKAIGEFWDKHELSDFWDKTRKVDFEVDIDSEVIYYAIERELSEHLQSVALKHGISAGSLINSWVQEKLNEQEV
ncbi:MAG: hypothetical protein HQL05_11575 [Nitrospirae bacterium]|uniref:CopG family antitoxin n=1 Tax=Candidatus Magnetobacterium casense TaxID=1455061 RepID=UPI00058B73AA|nr:CopG family antitoxin [Candidatus Magnetobacterium casensis]MBF0338458.1 hypothetical protein [Nitrospirota bacterium]